MPDSGVPAAIGYARGCGLPFELGIIRNHYVGRTFIQPTQSIRELGVRMKHNANRAVVAGKRVVLIDDSIVRGTTSVKIVQMMRDAGAREVHFRISSPPIAYPDFYGIDTPVRDKLLAARMDLESMREFMGADSLAFLSVAGHLSRDGLFRAQRQTAAVHRPLLYRRLSDPAHRQGRRAGAASTCRFWRRRAERRERRFRAVVEQSGCGSAATSDISTGRARSAPLARQIPGLLTTVEPRSPRRNRVHSPVIPPRDRRSDAFPRSRPR